MPVHQAGYRSVQASGGKIWGPAGNRPEGSADTGKNESPAEWPEDEGAGRADVHHYGNGPAWGRIPWEDPQADTKECLRLQGYHDGQIDRIISDTSDSQLYKQAGNGVTVNVIEAIGRNLREADAQLKEEAPV